MLSAITILKNKTTIQGHMETLIKSLLLLLVLLSSTLAHAERTTTYLHTDALGSVIAATDETGSLLWRKTYTPYGVITDSQENTQKIGFTGKPHDEELGLSYFGARWYDPEVGRFTGIDSVGFVEENIHSFNRYAYANNNPYKYVDPDGNFAFLAALPWVLGTISAALTGYEIGSTGYGVYSGDISAGDLAGDVGQDIAINTAIKAIPGGTALVVARKMGVDSIVNTVTKNADGLIYRGGSRTSTNLTPRAKDVEGLSANVNPLPGKNQVIDVSKLDKLCAVCDNPKTGHVSIKPKDQSQMQGWIDSRNSGTTHRLTQELQNAVVDRVKK